MQPKRSALAHRGRLRRLKMGKGQRGQILIFFSKIRQPLNHIQQLAMQQAQSVAHDDNVRIIANITAGSAQMNNAFGGRAAIAIGMNMRHHVMTQLFLISRRRRIINILGVSAQFRQLRIGYRQAKFLLGFRQHNPEPPPGAELVVRREDKLHLLAGITAGKWAGVVIVAHN